MDHITWKKGLALAILCLVGCCEEIEPRYASTSYQESDSRVDVYIQREEVRSEQVSLHRPFVVNNTPHIRRQDLPVGYEESRN